MKKSYRIPDSVNKKVDVDVAPLMDMVFILLIFFIVTTSFTKETGVDVTKPKASSAETLEKENILIAITKEGSIHIHERQVDLPMLGSILKRLVAERADRTAVIVSDREAPTGLTVDVMDECTMAGVKKVSIAAMKE